MKTVVIELEIEDEAADKMVFAPWKCFQLLGKDGLSWALKRPGIEIYETDGVEHGNPRIYLKDTP